MYKSLIDKLKANNVTLVAVSKTRTHDQLMKLYDQGQRIFGENRVAELVEKYNTLPKDIEWHMIGHLQSKKVKSIASFVDMIHSVDSEKLFHIIADEATKANRKISVLLQLKIAQEDSKYGLSVEELHRIIEDHQKDMNKHIVIKGLMGMASFVDDQDQVAQEFKKLKAVFDTCKEKYFSNDENFSEVSMGMSGDYAIAIKEGATMVRIGSLLFS